MQKTLKNSFADWIYESLKALKPPENITVSEWADKYRTLDAKTAAEPGKWCTERTPYLKFIMDSFCDPEVEDITFMKSAQVGGTECLNNILGYVICQDPSPVLVVYPTLDLAEYTSKNRIQPMIKHCTVLNCRYNDEYSKILELQFDGMYLVLSGANSPASLASRPIKILLLDEIDKFPRFSGKEADPISLAKERQKTFTANKKTFKASTPTTRLGPIFKAWQEADTQYKYFVSCPHCGYYQTLTFKSVKWPKTIKSPEEVFNAAYYECENCKGTLNDYHIAQMVKTGEWRAIKSNGKRKIAFHINALYSPWVRIGDVAYEFVTSQQYPEKLMNFVNSWLAEIWEDVNTKLDVDIVLERQDIYEEGVVPDEAIILTGGVDCQKDCYYWTIRAWGLNMTSWNIAHGCVQTKIEIERIMDGVFKSRSGKPYQVALYAIDTGYDTDSVYDYIASHSDCVVPVKGSSRPMTQRYKMSYIDRATSRANGMMLYIVDTAQYKDMISGRLKRPNGRGSWMVFKGCDREYAEQISAEEKILQRKGAIDYWIWKPKASNVQNHYLDCEVYAALAADLLHVRYLTEYDIKEPEPPKQSKINKFINSEKWIMKCKDWIK